MSTIIALRGKGNSGKTATIRILHEAKEIQVRQPQSEFFTAYL